MGDIYRNPTFFDTYRRSYLQVEHPPNVTAQPFAHVAPFRQQENFLDRVEPRKWAQDHIWQSFTTLGIPVPAASPVTFRPPTFAPTLYLKRIGDDPVPNNQTLLYAINAPSAPPVRALDTPIFSARSDRDFHIVEGLSYLPGPVIAPYRPVDFPTPMRARQSPQDFSFQSLQIQAPKPFKQDDWPLFLPRRAPLQDFQWVGVLTRGIPITPPFVFSDWPTPVRARSNIQDWIYAGVTTRNIPTGVNIAPTLTDWPLPMRPKMQYSDSYESPQILLVLPILPPFAPIAWEQFIRTRDLLQDHLWPGYTTRGIPPAPTAAGLLPMPNCVGVNYYMALLALQESGIYEPVSVLDFNFTTIAVRWAKTSSPGGIVISQSIPAGTLVAPNTDVTLTVSMYPFSAEIDSPPDWKQRYH